MFEFTGAIFSPFFPNLIKTIAGIVSYYDLSYAYFGGNLSCVTV